MRRLLALFLLSSCQGGGCDPTSLSLSPLPAPLPPDEIVEGAVQVRVSRAGFARLEEAAPPLFSSVLAGGLCVPPTSIIDGTLSGRATVCMSNGCPNAQAGCLAHATLRNIAFSAPDGGPLGVDVTLDLQVPLAVTYDPPLLPSASCTLDVKAQNLRVAIKLALGAATDGTLAFETQEIRLIDLPLSFGGCSVLGPTIDTLWPLVRAFLESALGGALVDLLRPTIDQLIQGFLPRPLGLSGLLDAGKLLGSLLPGLSGAFELWAVPGGHVELKGGGLSLGLMIGVGSDADPTTRSAAASGPGSYHEHAPCVPDVPLVLPTLPRHPARGTFVLPQVPAFAGMPEASGDFAVGVSHTLLDLFGFHAVNSGLLCASVGTKLVPLLTVGTLGIVLPSLGKLADDDKAPLLLRLRPQQAIHIGIGTGAADPTTHKILDPVLALDARQLKVDFYAWVRDGYERAFTMVLDTKIGVNVEFQLTPDGKPAILPVLGEITSENLTIQLEHAELLAESKDDLQRLFPMLVGIIVPAVSGMLQAFPLPTFGGYTLSDLSLGKLDSGGETFLAVQASLGAVAAGGSGGAGGAGAAGGGGGGGGVGGGGLFSLAPLATTRIVRTEVAAPDRATLQRAVLLPSQDPGRDALPSVTVTLGEDALGRSLEHQWRLDGGGWHAFSPAAPLVIRDPTLLLEGAHLLQVRARVVGDWRSLDLAGATVPVAITFAKADESISRSSGCATGARSVPSGGLVLLLALVLSWRRRVSLVLFAGLGACSDEKPAAGIKCGDDSQCASAPCRQGALALCDSGACVCADDVPLGKVGRYAALAEVDGRAMVAAYNETYGDLCVGAVVPPGRVTEWAFVDGVPEGPVVAPGSRVRRGVRVPGDDVGRYPAIAVGKDGQPRVVAYDASSKALRYAVRSAAGASGAGGAGRGAAGHGGAGGGVAPAATWRAHAIEIGGPGMMDPDVGRWPALAILEDGRPAVAYYAEKPVPGGKRGELHLAVAQTAAPTQTGDWRITALDGGALEPMPPAGSALPHATGQKPSLVALPGGDLAVAYYDARTGDLVLARWSAQGGQARAPEVIDGATMAKDTGDQGFDVALAVGPGGALHALYQDAVLGVLRHQDLATHTIELVDDGLRTEGKNADGRDEPVRHWVGQGAVLLASGDRLLAYYQDSTAHGVLSSVRSPTGGRQGGPWDPAKPVPALAAIDPLVSGWYLRGVLTADEAWLSYQAYDPKTQAAWVEVQALPVSVR